jgi:hypothetical protein
MKLNVLTIALAATAFGALVANAQSTTITTQERGGFLGTESKTTTTTTGTGPTGDCTNRTVEKSDLTGTKAVSRTDCP